MLSSSDSSSVRWASATVNRLERRAQMSWVKRRCAGSHASDVPHLFGIVAVLDGGRASVKGVGKVIFRE